MAWARYPESLLLNSFRNRFSLTRNLDKHEYITDAGLGSAHRIHLDFSCGRSTGRTLVNASATRRRGGSRKPDIRRDLVLGDCSYLVSSTESVLISCFSDPGGKLLNLIRRPNSISF